MTGNLQISTQTAKLHPRQLAISLDGRAGLGSRDKPGGSIFRTQMALDLVLETTQLRPLHLAGNLQISTQMALLDPRHLAISLNGSADRGSWKETEGSIFCSQMAPDLILETTQPRPLQLQEIYKSLLMWH